MRETDVRTAKRTRQAGERLARRAGEEVDGPEVWWRLLREAPLQLAAARRLYELMPKEAAGKLRLL